MGAVVAIMGAAVWWSAACRIGAMHWRTHRLGAILRHWALALAGLALVAVGALGPVPAVAAGAVVGVVLLALVALTVPDWLAGPPRWACRHADA